MNGRKVVEALNSLFDDAVAKGLPVRDAGSHLLVDPAPNISIGDINNSGLTNEAKNLLATGFTTSGGLMQLKFMRHQPTDCNHGQMTLEFSGRSSRIGAEVISQHGSDLEPTNLKFVPATKMIVLYGGNSEIMGGFRTFIDRPEDEQEENALALVALARKAIGLKE